MPRVIPASDHLGSVFGDLEHVFDALATLADRTVTLAHQSKLRRGDLTALRPLITDILTAHSALICGVGVITLPGLLADAPRWLEWWWTASTGAPEALRVNLDPSAPDFYDYTAAEWFAPHEAAGTRRVTGPYVDHACTGEYTLTLSTPIVSPSGPLGVAAADILISSLESKVMPALIAFSDPVALCNADGRVLASTSPGCPAGLRLPAAGPAQARSPFGSWLLVKKPAPAPPSRRAAQGRFFPPRKARRPPESASRGP